MKRILSIVFLASSILVSTAQDVGLVSLDKVLSLREDYIDSKLEMIEKMEGKYGKAANDNERLEILQDLFNEYHTFRYDSAIVKVNDMMEIAQRANREDYVNLAKIYNAELLTTSGLFHEAMATLASVDRQSLSPENLSEFYRAYEWTFGSIANYAGASQYSEIYRQKAMLYQDSIISTLTEGTPEYWYWMGKKQYGLNNLQEAEQYLQTAFSLIPVDNRLYGQVAYGLAKCASARGDANGRRKYLTLSAISDQVCPLKENMALQTLAFDLAADPNADLKQANKYLNYALDDAVFFGNRLRLIEISQKIPYLVDNYEKKIISHDHARMLFLYITIGLGVILLLVLYLLWRLNKRVKDLEQKLDIANQQIANS